MLSNYLTIVASMAGFLSAGLWLYAATIKVQADWKPRANEDGEEVLRLDLNDAWRPLAKQGKLNAYAAAFTGLAVALQTISGLI